MNLSCYIIDDESISIDILKRYIDQTPGLTLTGTATNPLDALELFSGNHIPALTFLDIDMPQLNGLDVAELIGSVTQVVFTTAYRDYALEAFEQNAVDYILKPINYARFLKAVTKVRAKQAGLTLPSLNSNPCFFVKTHLKGQYNRVDIEQIRYIETLGNYINIYIQHEKITTYLTLSDVLSKLPATQFSRIHQSYIVNHAFLKSMEYGQVRLSTELSLPIGATYRTAFRQKMERDILLSKRDQP
jgi:two-component system LytT family response regulator